MMHTPQLQSLTTTGRLALISSGCAAVATWPHVLSRVPDLRGDDFPAALEAAALVLLAVAASWLFVVITAELCSRRLPGVPEALRVALFTGASVIVLAQPVGASTEHDLDGLPLPDRPTIGAVAMIAAQEPADARTVTVQPGDTLWGLVAESLAPDATTEEIASAVRACHQANRTVIGDDPDVIFPGQVLRLDRP